ncbi:MAG TPA: Gfo/Idh/MocA family oxidoreductase [Trueperaceae bacterium]|nr:Gfo/Idh/MocA family oxidoreductase [Trueperaceae bacterium]
MREPAVPIRLGMVGGGAGAFIGAVHRTAARLDNTFSLLAGALSSTPDKALASARDLGLARGYGSWQEMLDGELALPEDERIEAVSIVTPNHVHFPVAKAFAQAGFHVVCDKPLTHTREQARELVRIARERRVVFGVSYNYSGYPMVREARRLVAEGAIGTVRKVIVEYHQGWLATRAEAGDGNKQAQWRTDPARSGLGGAIGDIGSHAENLVATVTGLEIESLCAELTTFVEGRRLDDDANVLLRFHGGARGILTVSQIEVGEENDLRIRVYGETGSLTWHQEDPNRLLLKSLEGPTHVLTRGNGYLGPAAAAASRIPPGHPEAFLEAFANVYAGVADAIRGRPDADYPTVVDGARGVAFIEAVVASGRDRAAWTSFDFDPGA